MSFEVVLNPIHSTDGTVIGISGVTRDITGRKQAEEELVRKNEELQASYGQIAANEEELRRSLDELTLRESALLQSEERYRSFIAVSNTGAWEYHGKADFLWCSPEYFSMLGRDAGRFDMSGAANLKETWLDLLHPDDRERAGKHFAEYLGNGSAGMYENHFRVQHADGHWVWVWSRGRTLRDADGTLTDKTVGTHIDVTAGVCAEDALRESEGRYRSLYVDSRDAILLVSPERGFIAANPAAIQLFAFRNEQDFILCSPASLSPAYQPDGVLSTTKSQEMMHLALEKGSNFFEWTHCKSDGTEFPATVLLSRLESGGTQLLQATVRDITGQKRAEEESRQHEKTLEALNKIISAANYAGDLPSLLDAGLDTTLALLEYDAGGIYLTDHEAGTAAVVASRNLPGWLLEQVGNVSIRQPQYEPLLVRGIPIITEHYEQVSPEYAERSGFCSIASIPLVSRDCIIGALNVASTRRAVVTGEERETLLSIGRELGTTIVRFRAEDVAGENAANLEILFNSIDEMVFILALDGTILRANGAVRRTLGYSDEELTGRDVLSLHVPDRRDEALRIVQGMIAGTINSCPVPVVAKDGTVIEAETRVTRGWWDNREVLIGVTRDVTERKRAEEALKESEQKYRDLVESSQDAIFSVDRNGFYQFANSAYASTLGYTPEYFDGKSFWDIYPKDLADMRHEGVLKVFETGQPGEVEVVVPLPDRTLYYLAKTNPITDSKGNIVQVLVTATDITERKREEEALLINENRLQMTQEIGHIGCWEYDIKTNLMWGSEEGCHLFGYPRKAGSFPIENFASCITEPELVLKAFNDLIYEGKEYDLDFIINPKDGSAQKTLHSIGRLEKDELGNPVKVKGINHDITERKRAEEALRESEEKYRALFTAESDGIFVVDKETGTIIDCNDAVTSMYGYQKDEMIGRPNTAISAEPGATRAATSALPGFIPERHHKKKDGSVFPVEITANAISINGRDVIVAAVRDITERKRAEDALRQANRQLSLLSGITRHDIRNQLLTLNSYLALSRKTLGDTEKTREYILREERVAKTIERQILFTREYENLGASSPVWQNIGACIEPAFKGLDLTGIDLDVTGLENTEILADTLLPRVFFNLADNALRHGGEAMAGIRIFSRESGTGLVIVFEDDGAGVATGDKEMIFERGYGKNTGYGLFLIREILALTGITVTETGEPGKGARFEMAVPGGMWCISAGNE
jgi:PAS domain S-box-containing protein